MSPFRLRFGSSRLPAVKCFDFPCGAAAALQHRMKASRQIPAIRADRHGDGDWLPRARATPALALGSRPANTEPNRPAAFRNSLQTPRSAIVGPVHTFEDPQFAAVGMAGDSVASSSVPRPAIRPGQRGGDNVASSSVWRPVTRRGQRGR